MFVAYITSADATKTVKNKNLGVCLASVESYFPGALPLPWKFWNGVKGSDTLLSASFSAPELSTAYGKKTQRTYHVIVKESN